MGMFHFGHILNPLWLKINASGQILSIVGKLPNVEKIFTRLVTLVA